MLTIQGLGHLGLYNLSTDYYCVQVTGNYVCASNNAAVKTTFKNLQQTIKTIAARMAAAGRLAIPQDMTTLYVDGDVGRITSLGAQVIGAAFSTAVAPPAEVAYALEGGISGEETVKRIAARAVEIDNWFQMVAANFPAAIAPEPRVVKEIEEKIIEKIIYQEPTKSFRPIGAVVLAAGLLTIMGFAASAIVSAKRASRGGV